MEDVIAEEISGLHASRAFEYFPPTETGANN
jgi:hypothetical protein